MLGFYDSDDSEDEKFERMCSESILAMRQRMDLARKVKSRKRGGGMIETPRRRRGSVSEDVKIVQQACASSNDVLIRYGYTDAHNALIRLARKKELGELVEKCMQEVETDVLNATSMGDIPPGTEEKKNDQLHAHTFLKLVDRTLQLSKEVGKLRLDLKLRTSPVPLDDQAEEAPNSVRESAPPTSDSSCQTDPSKEESPKQQVPNDAEKELAAAKKSAQVLQRRLLDAEALHATNVRKLADERSAEKKSYEQQISAWKDKSQQSERELAATAKSLDKLKSHAESTLKNVNKEAEKYTSRILDLESQLKSSEENERRTMGELASLKKGAKAQGALQEELERIKGILEECRNQCARETEKKIEAEAMLANAKRAAENAASESNRANLASLEEAKKALCAAESAGEESRQRCAYFESGLKRILDILSSGDRDGPLRMVEIVTGLLSAASTPEGFDAIGSLVQNMEADKQSLENQVKLRDEEIAKLQNVAQELRVEARMNAEMGKQAEIHLAKSITKQANAVEALHRKVLIAEKDALEAKLTVSAAMNERYRLEEDVKELQSDVDQLRDQLRQARSRTPGDTYEEVMQEEMQAMKAGYERKIKAMKNEVKESRRNVNSEALKRVNALEKQMFAAASKVRQLEAALDASRDRVLELIKKSI